MHWYKVNNCHSGIRYVNQAQRQDGEDQAILQARTKRYLQAPQGIPDRWSGKPRDWSQIAVPTLDPQRGMMVEITATAQHTQQHAA